jgi:hypothetical protein
MLWVRTALLLEATAVGLVETLPRGRLEPA